VGSERPLARMGVLVGMVTFPFRCWIKTIIWPLARSARGRGGPIMRRRDFLKVAVVGGATVGTPVFLRNAWAQGGPIKIGMPAALSGAYAQYGIQARRAPGPFSQDIKAQGLPGRPVGVLYQE